MSHTQNLISFHIVERENNQNFLTWTYPALADDQEKYILQNCFATQKQPGCFCLRKNSVWFYIHHENNFAIVVLTDDFEPNKYKTVCDIFAKRYTKCRHPVELVKLYLSLFTVGSCIASDENGSCDLKNFKSVTNLKDFIRSFDLEIILLYNAILLKRRTLVYDNDLKQLQNELLTITSLVPCRNINDYLQPLTDTPKQLKGLAFYVAGTTNSDLIKEEELYDLLVNLQTREITVSPKAEEIMSMTKIHKDIATLLVKLSSSDLPETEIKEQILQKTNDLLSSLQSMASVTADNNVKMLTMNNLKSKNYQPALENFLFNLALAENIMML